MVDNHHPFGYGGSHRRPLRHESCPGCRIMHTAHPPATRHRWCVVSGARSDDRRSDRASSLARLRQLRLAAVCAEYPLLVACRQHATSAREPYGAWGGTTETERETIHVRARRAALGIGETG